MGNGKWEMKKPRLCTIIVPKRGSIAFPIQGKVAFAKQMTEEVVTIIPNS